ncbi:MAG TPA: RHS repeat-associated core domain-containing protein, partial [Acidobacteriaceae bacterium]|nr:RHS repeat-associated core domain-containing protein [Acidobacteriaceae bacterium]
MCTAGLQSSGGWPVWSGQFTPFGQEIVAGQVLTATLGNPQPGDGTNMHYKFTGKERDTESGLDYFGARYYASSMGRFMSPDPSGLAFANPANPQ